MSVNIPFQDDFDALLEPTVKILKGNYDGIRGFWNILYTQDDERRIVVDRLVSYWVYLLNGSLDLRIMMVLGISTYLILLGLFINWFRQENINWLYFLPIPFLLFTPINYGAVYWAMIPMQHIAVFIWSFLALWLLSRHSVGWFALGIVAAIIALYSDVTGTFLFLAGALVLFVQKKFKRLGVWGLVMGLLVFYYYYQLKVPDFRPPISENLRHFDSLLQILVTMPGMIVDIFPTLSDKIRLVIAGVAGLIILALVIWLFIPFIKKVLIKKQTPYANEVWVWGCLAFLFIVFSVFALGRASEGAGSILTNRYKHMFVYWILFIYLLLLRTPIFRHNPKILSTAGLGIALLYFFNAYFQNWEAVDYYRKVLLTDAYEWKNNRAIPSSPIYVAVRKPVDTIYEESIATGVYEMPSFYFERLANAPIKGSTPVEVENGQDFITFRFPEVSRDLGKNEGAYVILQAGSELHFFPTKNNHRSVLGVLRTGRYYHDGATSISILKKYLNASQFKLYAGVIKDNEYFRLSTGEEITL
ncbi:hypothetical protein [Telluribacter humicola]|uniref:hypothetical protein n=1 Tax=Telluribacter humicola TaxID=1720261 RepID=UPI001A95A620|nr:hypothetical protein [Telluribacter humicola]